MKYLSDCIGLGGGERRRERTPGALGIAGHPGANAGQKGLFVGRSPRGVSAGPRAVRPADLSAHLRAEHPAGSQRGPGAPRRATHRRSPCPWDPEGLNLSPECLVDSGDLTLKCLPDPSREHTWVKGTWAGGPSGVWRSPPALTATRQLAPCGHVGKRARGDITNLLTCQQELKMQTALYSPSF